MASWATPVVGLSPPFPQTARRQRYANPGTHDQRDRPALLTAFTFFNQYQYNALMCVGAASIAACMMHPGVCMYVCAYVCGCVCVFAQSWRALHVCYADSIHCVDVPALR